MDFTVEKGSEKCSQKAFSEGGFHKLPRAPPWSVRPLRRAPYFEISDSNPIRGNVENAEDPFHPGKQGPEPHSKTTENSEDAQKYACDPRSPHTRQKYEQTSGQNMTPNT